VRCGDLDGNGVVGIRDMVILLFAIHRDIEKERFDINRDGVVDARDLVALARQLGQRCGPSSAPPLGPPRHGN
jgi:hypothetical protein